MNAFQPITGHVSETVRGRVQVVTDDY